MEKCLEVTQMTIQTPVTIQTQLCREGDQLSWFAQNCPSFNTESPATLPGTGTVAYPTHKKDQNNGMAIISLLKPLSSLNCFRAKTS